MSAVFPVVIPFESQDGDELPWNMPALRGSLYLLPGLLVKSLGMVGDAAVVVTHHVPGEVITVIGALGLEGC